MREGDEFVPDRVVKGFNSESPLKKFAYLPTRDNRFLLQISRDVQQDYQDERSSLSYDLLVKTVTEGNPDLKSVHIYNSAHNITVGSSDYPEGEPDMRTDSILTQVFSTRNPEIYTDIKNKTVSHYVFIQGQKDDSPSSKYMNRVGNFTYSTKRLDEQITTTLIFHLVIALISVIIGLFFAYGLTRRITSPVDRIIEDIDHISGGDLNYPVRSTGQSELIHLEHSIAHMVERLKNHIKYLNVSESRYHILFNSSYDPILLLRDTRIIDSNQAAKKIFPDLNSNSDNINLVDIFSLSDSSEEKDELFNRLIATAKEKGTIEEEYPFILSDCSVHHLMMRFTAVVVEDTTHIHLLIQDMTDRKLAWKTHVEDEALKESYRQIQIIIDLLPDPTFAINAQGEIILWNHAMEEISGMNGSDVLGKADRIYALPLYGTMRPTLVDLILDPSLESTEVYPQITRKGRVLSDEIYIDSKNDGGSYFSAVASPLYDSNGGSYRSG